MLKIIVDRADNGNRFLCQECVNGFRRSGRRMEENILCVAQSGPAVEITYPVTKCSGFKLASIDEYNSPGLKVYKRSSMYLDNRAEVNTGKPNKNYGKFITFADAVNTRLVFDE